MSWRTVDAHELLLAVVVLVLAFVGLPMAIKLRLDADERDSAATSEKFQRNTIACTKLGGAAIKQTCYLNGKKIPLDAAFELYQLSLALNNLKTESL